jgi:hypothetical protein
MTTWAYTPHKPPLGESSDQLRARIPGWGADLDPADRPAFPQERFDPDLAGAHWQVPDFQPEKWPRERSIEHASLTPVFGTSCPPKGLSGRVRRYAYASYSEARAAHWLLLMAADRIDVVESTGRSLFSLRPDNPLMETGLKTEVTSHGLRSRLGRHRTDVVHHPLDPVIVAGPWVTGALVARAGVKRLRHALAD